MTKHPTISALAAPTLIAKLHKDKKYIHLKTGKKFRLNENTDTEV